jgi:hypothetical protein
MKKDGSGFRVQGSEFRVQSSGFRVQGSEFRVQDSEFIRVAPRRSKAYWGIRVLHVVCWGDASPRSGRKRVAQGKSAHPWGDRQACSRARGAGDRGCFSDYAICVYPRVVGIYEVRTHAALNLGLRGLALGYMLSPATRACVNGGIRMQGSVA